MDLANLDEAVQFYCYQGLADSTHRTYRSGLNRFLSFCYAMDIQSPFPVSETVLCYFVTALASQGTSLATIRTYLATVRHAQVVRGHPEPRQLSSLPRLRLVQNGVRRERAVSGANTAVRLPITASILHRIRPFCLSPPASYDSLLLWAAATTCYFGFFRAGELTVPSALAFNPAFHLSWGDVAISDSSPRTVRIFLRRSKSDQFGRGVNVFLGETGDGICPVLAVMAYAAVRGGSPGPFFRTTDGLPLTKARFVAQVRGALTHAGIPIAGYSGHSFRIGAATAAAQAGIPDSVIQSLGRWSSTAFLRYIRTPREQLASFTSAIAS